MLPWLVVRLGRAVVPTSIGVTGMRYRVLRLLGVFVSGVLYALGAAPANLPGQTPGGEALVMSGHTPFAIAVPRQFEYEGADAVIVRRGGRDIPDVILVRRGHVNAETLASAVRHLAVIRASRGERASEEGVYRVRTDGRGWVRPGEEQHWIEALDRSRGRALSGYGVIPFVVLFMPNQRR